MTIAEQFDAWMDQACIYGADGKPIEGIARKDYAILGERLIAQPSIPANRFCEVLGCEFAFCGWTGLRRCYHHSMEQLGEAEMKRRYESTHYMTWEQFRASD